MFTGLGKLIPIPIKDIYSGIRISLENNIVNLGDKYDISEISPNLFIGNISSSTNKDLLIQKGITHIISVLSSFNPPYLNDFYYHFVQCYDLEDQPLIEHFLNCNRLIDDVISHGGKVFIHCMSGRSRSVTIVMAYLMSHKNIHTDDLLKFIRTKREIAEPNPGFIKQLDLYYNTLYNPDNESEV
ncbi:Dual specificity phosphatase, catalytic domain [seawater metagenome]|uniref:Dual specificity phosphatase, catalytic domain n=1 Tax=seawater metagenome TaxID=1561972 RepID=A0A5E8CJW9_9ZZZZ